MNSTCNQFRLPKSAATFAFAVVTVLCGGAFSRAGVETSKSSAARPVWPPPPSEPRVVYVRSFSRPADLGIKPSIFKRMGKWIAGGEVGNQSLVTPLGVALDEKGGICVTDTGTKTVSYIDPASRHWQRWDGVGEIHFLTPVAVEKRGSTLFIADSGLAEVVVFDTSGKLLFLINHDLGCPSGLTIMAGQLYVSDVARHCVVAFDMRGNREFSFGKRGIGPGEFNFPTHLATDNRGHLLVTDSLNSRVQVFDAKGHFETQIGSEGDTSGHFGRPKGVAVDSFGHIYVADAVFDNLQVFDFSGRLLLNLGESGTGPGEFGLPNGIAIGTDNQIYVADSYNHRIQVFKYVGQP